MNVIPVPFRLTNLTTTLKTPDRLALSLLKCCLLGQTGCERLRWYAIGLIDKIYQFQYYWWFQANTSKSWPSVKSQNTNFIFYIISNIFDHLSNVMWSKRHICTPYHILYCYWEYSNIQIIYQEVLWR